MSEKINHHRRRYPGTAAMIIAAAPHPDASSYAGKFPGKYAHRIIKGGIGHNLPQEAPEAFARAVIDVDHF